MSGGPASTMSRRRAIGASSLVALCALLLVPVGVAEGSTPGAGAVSPAAAHHTAAHHGYPPVTRWRGPTAQLRRLPAPGSLPSTQATSDQAGSTASVVEPLLDADLLARIDRLSRLLLLAPQSSATKRVLRAGVAGVGSGRRGSAPWAWLPPLPGGPQVDPLASVAVDLGALFTTQFDGSRFADTNCNMASAAMLFEVQTGRPVSGAQLRAWSGAVTSRTGLTELQHAFASQGQAVNIAVDLPWAAFARQVRSGRSAVVQGWYGYVPARYDLQPGFHAAHSIFVLGYSRHALGGRGGFYVMDPLGRAGYDGAWWTASALHAFGWSGQPGHDGDGPRAFFGNVAFQARPSAKQLDSPDARPVFQSYWATAKALIEQALKVTITSQDMTVAGTGLPDATLRISDPRLRLTAADAARLDLLRLPVSAGHVVAPFSPSHRSLDIGARRGSRVVAAASGVVMFRGWSSRTAGETLWLMHGPNLYTGYARLRDVRVRPGQWVRQGAVLGRLVGPRSAWSATLRFRVVAAAHPWSAAGRVDPSRFLVPTSWRAG